MYPHEPQEGSETTGLRLDQGNEYQKRKMPADIHLLLREYFVDEIMNQQN